MPDPEDDRSVEDGSRLYRWLGHDDFKWDYNLARARPTSAVFQHDDMSVVLGDRHFAGTAACSPRTKLSRRSI